MSTEKWGSQDVTEEEYMAFMSDRKNTYRCSACPQRLHKYDGLTAEDDRFGYGLHLPCGQQNCWVKAICTQQEGKTFYA